MYALRYFLLALGGISFFLLGLKFMSENMEKLAGLKMQKVLKTFTKNKYSAVLTGAVSTALLQSSIATNVITVGFVSSGILSFYSGACIVMGANVGTTMTAQLVSLSGSELFDITALGSLISFIGFTLMFLKSQKLEYLGGVMVGFGMLFFGLDVISYSVSYFKNFQAFRNIFLVENDLLLFLNGIIITAIIQSSSAVTSIMIVLASNGLLSFENSMFLILGANVGSCFSVILASLNKPIEARRVAYFNLFFNVLGSLLLFLPLTIFKYEIGDWFLQISKTIEREIANFHTLFNVLVTMILLPFIKPFTRFIEKVITNKQKKKKYDSVNIQKLPNNV